MKHIYNLSDARLDRPAIVTIGVFDGVHRGHQHLLKPLIEHAHKTNRLAVVLTLFPHPDVVLRGLQGRYYLTTPEQKAHLLGSFGVDVVVTQPFNDEVRQIRAASFVDQLLEHLNMAELWVTSDFAMGHEREGNFEYLSQQGREKGFEVRRIELLADNGDPSTNVISSTAIRKALEAGQVEQAAQWLGRNYCVEGPVIHGDHRGRTLGFPTANLDIWREQVLPANGIYACWVTLDEERLMAMTNVGVIPQFTVNEMRVEAYILDFDRDIYGQKLYLEFVAWLRPEEKFSSVDALVQQIHLDVQKGRKMLESITG